MSYRFTRVAYDRLNARQREAFNFQKISALLAEYGFVTIRLTSDWRCADFIAQHKDGTTFLKIQLKGRLAFYKKYMGNDLHICFREDGDWFIYPHDELLKKVLATSRVGESRSWKNNGGFSFPKLTKKLRKVLAPYKIKP